MREVADTLAGCPRHREAGISSRLLERVSLNWEFRIRNQEFELFSRIPF
jgi:hypothetical protein